MWETTQQFPLDETTAGMNPPPDLVPFTEQCGTQLNNPLKWNHRQISVVLSNNVRHNSTIPLEETTVASRSFHLTHLSCSITTFRLLWSGSDVTCRVELSLRFLNIQLKRQVYLVEWPTLLISISNSPLPANVEYNSIWAIEK